MRFWSSVSTNQIFSYLRPALQRGLWREQQIGQESFERADTEITQVPAVRTPVNQRAPKQKLQNVTTGLHLMDTCWQAASPVMSGRIPTVLCSLAKKTSKLADLSGPLQPSRRLESRAKQPYPFKNQPPSCSSSFSAGSQSQLVAGITSAEAHEPK